MLGEPPRSQGDLHFNLFGFPVRIHPWFWLVAVLLGLGGGGKLIYVFIWVVAMLLSILVHELGHAFAMRAFGLRPWITLYGMGGLASYDTSQLMQSGASDWKKQIFICFAGPGVGFLLAAFLLLLTWATGHGVEVGFGTEHTYFFGFKIEMFASEGLWLFVVYTVFISLIWGMINLLPIYPLDGGQITREVFLRIDHPSGLRRSLMLSMIAAGLFAAYLLFSGLQSMQETAGSGSGGSGVSLLPVIFFGYLCFSSWSMLQTISGGRHRW